MVQLRHLPIPQVVFVADPDSCAGIGGVLVRSGLAYLESSQQVLADLRPLLDRVSSSSDLYRRVLTIAVVDTMAVDRFRVSQGLRRGLHQAGSAVCRPAARASLAPINSLIFRLAHLVGVGFASCLVAGPLASESLSLGWIPAIGPAIPTTTGG